MLSPKFNSYADSTKVNWSRELYLAERHETLGGLLTTEIRPALVQAFLDGLAHLPGKQATALDALKQVERWALVRDMLPHPITLGCETIGTHGGYRQWSDEEVALAEHHTQPLMSRVITLGANTGQRGSDLVRMTWADIEIYQGRPGINVIQKKTRRRLWIPMTERLREIMATWERGPWPLAGRIQSRVGLTSMWYRERRNPALKPLADAGLVLHGLRATACVRLLHAGANTRQIADMVGMSERIVAHYCRFAVQRENALAAVIQLERTRNEQTDRNPKKSGS